MKRRDKIKGSLFGGAIGDALGYQIEFESYVKDRQVTGYERNRGIISDDTQMTLFTANALLWRDTRFDLKGIAPRYSDAIYMGYLDWLETQIGRHNQMSVSWIKNIPELNKAREPGATCLSSLMSGKKGTIDEPLNYSKGCGAVMRIAPIAIYVDDPILAGNLAAESAALTHGHPSTNIAAFVCSTLINILLNSNKSIEEALEETLKLYKDNFDIFGVVQRDNFLQKVEEAKRLSKLKLKDTEAIKKLGEGWVSDEAFVIALYSCLKYQNSFKEAIVCAVNHGGDSDSTGAIAGNIIGARLGYSQIPKYYIDNLELKDVIEEISNDLMNPLIGKEKDDKWLDKYLYLRNPISEKGNVKVLNNRYKKDSLL